MKVLPQIVLLLATVGLLLPSNSNGVEVPKTNVVFFLIDDLGWKDLGCYGSDYYQTPNIDRLAASGLRFARHYVQVATCGASRHALLTGLRPSVAADYNNYPFMVHRKELAARPTESFFHLLKQNGYHTTSVGKISHLASQRDLPRSWTEVLNPARSPKLPPQFYRKAPNGNHTNHSRLQT